MTDRDLASQIDALNARLNRVEHLLGVPRQPVDPPSPPPVAAAFEAQVLPAPMPPMEALARQLPPPLPAYPSHAPAPKSIVATESLEQTIGLRWAGWVGAVVLVIGSAFGIKFAYEQGWFSIVTPTVRLCLAAMVGFALIAAGEWVYRKVNTLSAAGLFGAGVAILFVVSYAGHVYYGLYERNTAFAFMAFSTVIGATVARRGQMVSIAVLAMIGGNLAPLLLTNDRTEYFGFFVYLFLLQITSLLLAAWGATPKWWTLRGLSLATTSFWMLDLINNAPPQMSLAFSLLFAALFHAELQFSAQRSKYSAAQAGVTFSLLVTAALTAAIVFLQRNASQIDRLTSLLGLAAIFAVISFVTLRLKKRSTVTNALGVGYVVQSLALLAVAVPVAFSGLWITAAWSVLAVILAAVGRFMGLSTAKFAAPVAWFLAAINLVLWTMGDSAIAHRGLIWFDLLGYQIPVYLLMSGVLALTGRVLARLNRVPLQSNIADEFSLMLNITSGLIWVIASINALPMVAFTASILFYANLLLLEDWFFPDRSTLVQAVLIVLGAAFKWALFDTLLHRLNDPVAYEPLLLSANGFVAMALLVSLLFLYLVAATPRGVVAINPQKRRWLGGVILAMILWMGSFEIDRVFINDSFATSPAFSNPEHAEQVTLSMFWSIFAIVMIGMGFVRNRAGLRYFGLTVFAITVLKVVTIDLSQVSTGFRILSFMVLGLLLLGTSVLYGKVSPRLLDKN